MSMDGAKKPVTRAKVNQMNCKKVKGFEDLQDSRSQDLRAVRSFLVLLFLFPAALTTGLEIWLVRREKSPFEGGELQKPLRWRRFFDQVL